MEEIFKIINEYIIDIRTFNEHSYWCIIKVDSLRIHVELIHVGTYQFWLCTMEDLTTLHAQYVLHRWSSYSHVTGHEHTLYEFQLSKH